MLRRWVGDRAGNHAGWFEDSLDALAAGAPERELHMVLGLAPRRLGKADLALDADDLVAAGKARPGWRPVEWTVDGAARVSAILVHTGDRLFSEKFKDLRRTADAAELIALYCGLPLYPDAGALAFEAEEGLRSNSRAVFEAIAHHNPYPRDHFDEHRWNHMILKALFVGSRLAPVIGIDERSNPELARILCDYAHERWAAERPVPPELWRCVGPFATNRSVLDDLRHALSGTPGERAAAALALAASPADEARAILRDAPAAAAMMADGRIGWDRLPGAEAA